MESSKNVYSQTLWRVLKDRVRSLPDRRAVIFCNMVHHDVFHLLVAQMEPIQIGDIWVDGVSGLKVKHFHQTAWEPLYDGGTLDELRVAIHEAILLPSIVSILRLTEWSRWMLIRKINPIWVIFNHYKAYRKWLHSDKVN